MTVVETVLFSGVVELKAYVLSELDNLGKTWDENRWKDMGEGELVILQPQHGGNIRCMVKGSGISNKDQDCPNSRTPNSEEAKDTCLDLLFQDSGVASEFERQYVNCQDLMAKLHASTKDQWSCNINMSAVSEIEKPLVVRSSPIASTPKKQPHLYQVTPTFTIPTDEQEKEEGAEDEKGYESDEDEEQEYANEEEGEGDYEQFDDGSEGTHYSGSSGSCSEISLESTDEDERAELQQQRARKKMIVPSLAAQQKMWKCLGCTTPNPEDVDKCLCCEVPKGEKKLQKEDTGPKIDFGVVASSSSSKPTFNFGSSDAPKPSFDFSGSGSGSTSAGFSFGAPAVSGTSSFSFGTKAEDKNTSNTSSFSFGTKVEDKNTEEIVNKAEKAKASPYPPMETMKKVEPLFPSKKEEKPKTSPYPPMETMKKVEPMFPAKKEVKPAAVAFATTKPKASPYPPMETMKKVEPMFPAKKEAKAETKPKASPYPPMETMKKVEPMFPAKKEEKPKASPYPPMETMKKVEPMFPPKANEEHVTTTPVAAEKKAESSTFGLSKISFGDTSSTESPFATTTGSLFGSSSKPVFGGSGFGSTPLTFGGSSSPDTGMFGKPVSSDSPKLFGDMGTKGSLFGSTSFGKTSSTSSTPSSSNSFKDDVKTFYLKYNPDKVSNVDALIAKFKGRESKLAENLCKKYNLTSEQQIEYFPNNSASSTSAHAGGQSSLSGFSSSLGAAPSTSSGKNNVGGESRRGSAATESSDDETDEERNKDNSTTTSAKPSLFGGVATTPTFAAPTLATPSSGFGFASTTPSATAPASTSMFGFASSGTGATSTPSSNGGSGAGVAFGQSSSLGSSGQAVSFGTPSFGTPASATNLNESKQESSTGSFAGVGFASFAGSSTGFGDGSGNTSFSFKKSN